MNILEALQAQSGETGETFIDVNPNGPTAVPGGDDLLLSEFAHLGTDLQITLPSGDEIVIVDYFSGDGTPPALVTEGGAVMNGDLVNQLAGPMVPDTQVAQSGTSDALGEPAGTIDSMTGVVTATRGGVEVELNAGDAIYEGDVLNTADGSAVGIIFSDDSTMSMGANARISIDEMVFDAEAGQGSQLFDIVQGAFVFASGQIGHNNPEDVQVRTPVATIGIRGTKYAVDVDQELGDATVTLFEGAVVVENSAGQVLLNSIGQSTRIGSAFESPGDVFVMDPDTQTETYGDAIDYHPNAPQLREDDDGGGDDGPVDGDDLSAEELEELAEQLDDLDTAAGPSGAIAGFSQSALFLRLLNGVLEGNDIVSGELAGEDGAFGTQLPFLDLINKSIDSPLGQIGGDDGFVFDRSFGAGDFGPGGGTVTFTFGSASNVSVTGGSSALDVFSIDVTGSSSGTTWTVGQNASGNVVISESGGTNINMDEVEELAIDLGGSSDTVTIGNLGNTDIAQSTVSIDGGDGDDIINAALAGKRLVAEGGDGDDQILGGTSNDNLFGDDGADTLAGGTGNDLLVGGDGDDTILVQANGTGINEFTGYQDEIAKLNDLIADLDQETDSEEIATLQQKIEDLSREVDIVQGGDGNDTLTLSFSPGLLLQPGVVDDLIALKSFVDNGGEGTQTFEALGLQVSGIETLNFVNLPTPDASASLSIGEAVEDGTVDVALTLGGDQGGLFSTFVTISGVPTGATLVAADGTEYAGGGDIELSGDAVGDFSIVLAPDSDEDFQLSVAVSAENVLDGGTATGSVVGTVAVDGVADAPVVSVVNAAGDEDSQISLSIDVGQGDADGSEQLSVAIEGLPVGAILSDANGNLIDPADVPVDALQGLQLLAPLNFSGTLNLTVVATSTEGGTSETTSQSFTVDVAGVADIVETVVEDVVGTEDSLIPLSIDVDLTDADEALTISIDGLPEGASLVDAAGNAVDAASIPVEALDGLQLSVADNFSGDISLTVNATNADGESTGLTSQGFTVSITPVADNPVLTLGDGSGNEDGSIDLNLDVGLTDLDGSETLTVSITGLPSGAVLKDADGNVVDPTDVPAGALGNLSLLPPQDFSGDINLTVTATSTDGDSTAIQTGGLTVSVAGVADAPTLTVEGASGQEGVPLSLNISSALTDTDGSETLTVSISGLPDGAVLKDADGNVVDPANVPTSALNALTLLPALGTIGSFALTVTATATEADGDSASVTETLNLNIGEVAAAPVLSVLDAVGNEDGSIALSISATPGQEGDTVTITIDNLPAGATLTNDEGETFEGGASITLTPDQLAGLTVHPASNSDADLNLTVTATASDGGATAEVSSGLSVTIDAVADTPTLTVSNLTGSEGVPLSLNISAELMDSDGSETLSIEISGLPEGFSITDGQNTYSGDPVSIPASAISSLTLLPVVGVTGALALTVTATATEADGGDSASISQTIGINLSEVAAAPVLSVLDAVGNEDGSIALSISAAPGQVGDTVTVTIDNLPAGATLTNADGETFEGGSSITLTTDQLNGLTVHPAPDSDADLSLTVTATAVDGQAVETTSSGLTVTVDAVADVPTLTVSDVTGAFGRSGVDILTGTSGDDTLIGGAGGDTLLGGDGNDTLIGDGDLLPATVSLDITSALEDIDGSESLSVTISGIPEGVQLLQDGVVLVTGGSVDLTGLLDSLTLIVPPGTPDFDLTVTATATESSNQDTASAEATISVTLDDGSELGLDDVLDGGAGDDVILGGAGNDTISSGEGADTIDGGAGNDVISVIQEGAGDIIDGGEGTDTLTLTVTDWDLLDVGIVADVLALVEFVASGAAATGSKVFNSLGIEVRNIEAVNIVDINGDPIDPDNLEGITFTGGDGDDIASGTQFDDKMSGGDGDDTLSGLGGDDDLKGGDGNDVLLGGAGDDKLKGEDGNDTLDGGDGDDELKGGDGNDILQGGAGDDKLKGEDGNDTLDGGDGDDELKGGDGNDILQGGAGDDELKGEDGDDVLDGGAGTDTLVGGKGDDTLDGGDGDDTVWGGTGDDVISGGAGDDTLDGGDGDDTIYGGAGDDTITGGSGDDVIHSDGGNDVIFADDGDDVTIVTIDSADTDRDISLNGGDGDDTLRISLSEDHPGLDAVMAEINAATLAAQQNPGAVQTIESLGITFQNYEDIEIYVGGEQVSYDPTVSGQGDVSTDTAAMETGVLVLTDLDVQDIDGDVLMQATVEISGGFAEGDKLTVDEDLLSDLGITLESAEATEDGFALVLSGDASIEDYEAALASVRLSSDTGAPDVGTRTIGVTVTDDDGNEADPIFVSVDVGVGEESDLADVGGTGQDSVAFISETDEVGTTVDSVSDIVATTTETLSVSVGKNGNGNTGEFEVIVNGQSMGTFTTTSKATGSNGSFETIEIGEISLPQGAEASIEVRAVSSNSGVLLQGITYGSVAIDAESGDTSSIGGIFDEVINGISSGQSFSDIWSGLSDNFSNLFSDSYVFLDPDGDSSSYTLTPGEGDGSTSDWQQTDGDTTTTPDTSDLGERYDSIDMGGGTDWAVASAGTENDLNVDLSDDAWAGTENVLGGKGDDTLRGNEDANLIAGGDGNDVLIADGGNDLLVGGAGDDEGHFDISDLKQAGSNSEGQSFGTLDQAISDAYAANDTDGAEALENIRAGFDGGSGTDTLKLSGGGAEGTDLSSDEIVDAVSNIEILDVTGVQGPVDMSLSVDDLIEMTDDNDELKIMKDGDDTVNIGGQEYGVGEHTFNVDGVDFKVVIEETPPEGG